MIDKSHIKNIHKQLIIYDSQEKFLVLTSVLTSLTFFISINFFLVVKEGKIKKNKGCHYIFLEQKRII